MPSPVVRRPLFAASALLVLTAAVSPGVAHEAARAPVPPSVHKASRTSAADPTMDAHALVQRTLAAIGGRHDVHAFAAMRAEATIVTYDVVENDHLGPPYPFQGASRASFVDDLHGDRRLVTERPAATPDVQKRTWFVSDRQWSDTLHAGVRTPGAAVDAPPSWEMQNPIRALLLAERADDLVLEPDVVTHEARQHVLAFHHGRYPARVFIDALTGLPSATEATIAVRQVAWNAWGDVVERTEFMIWDTADGVRFPMQWDTFRNGALYRTAMHDGAHFDASLGADALPPPPALNSSPRVDVDDVELSQPIPSGPDPKRHIEEIAPDVVQIPGSWYATLVRQDDGVVIVDAPISAGYSRRVLAEAARRFPGLPIKAVITSTGFYWHIAGVREYAARGIPIYARDRNAPIVRRLVAAPHTLFPDDLARKPRTPVVHAISARTVIGRGRNAIVLMPVRYGEQPMLMTWIADAHLLHTGEMVQPLGPNGSLLFPESLLELKQSIEDAGLSTADLRLIGMHMSPTPWGKVEAAIAEAGL